MDWRNRKGLFKRPNADDDFEGPGEVVKAKPLPEKIAKKLGSLSGARTFVTASSRSQQEFYGNQEIKNEQPVASSSRLMTQNEKNKVNAKLIKAEMMGDKKQVKKLKRRLEEGTVSDDDDDDRKDDGDKDIMITKTDKRTGVTKPYTKQNEGNFDTQKDLRQIIEEERNITAEDQMLMYNRLAHRTANDKQDDDWTIDDNMISKQETDKRHKRKKMEKEKRREEKDKAYAIQEQKRLEETLDSCSLCMDGRKLQKHLVVAIGITTYLSVPSRESLVENHCLILPRNHASSSIQLDEDVYDEMRIWRKGLVAMFADHDMDCVFMETAKNVQNQPHMYIECIPLPREIGDMAPIYFKKAILECEEEWAQNKKLVDLSAKDIRRSIPKGFSYFAIDFGLQGGFAHVIEDESKFPAHFGREIIGGMLDLDHNLWRKPVKQKFEDSSKKCKDLKTLWEPFDWTKRVREAQVEKNDSDSD